MKQGHSRNPSTASTTSSVGPIQPGSHSFDGFVVAMHRKMVSQMRLINSIVIEECVI